MSALALAVVEAIEALLTTLQKHEQAAAEARIQEILAAGSMPDLANKWEAAKRARLVGLSPHTFRCDHCDAEALGAENQDGSVVEIPPGWLSAYPGGDKWERRVCSPTCARDMLSRVV